jgi:glyoxylase-like metal-dependent hydrolase (beta-lactamase superfamily II)
MLKAPLFSHLRRRLVLDNVDMKLEDGEILDILGGLQVVHTPGHTAGSISLYFPAYKILIVGDALAKRRNVVFMPHRSVSSDFKQASASVRKMSNLDVKMLLFGHGRPITEDAQGSLRGLVEKISPK